MKSLVKDLKCCVLIQRASSVCRLCCKVENDKDFVSAHDELVIITDLVSEKTTLFDILCNITNMAIETEELSDRFCKNCCQQLLEYNIFRINCLQQEKNLNSMVHEMNKQYIREIKEKNKSKLYISAFTPAALKKSNKNKCKIKQDIKPSIGTMCQQCGKAFKVKYSLNKHLYVCKNRDNSLILSAVKYSCDQCSASFFVKSRLKEHLERVHSDRKIPCEVCGKLFKTEVHLKNHLAIHADIRKYKCKYCKDAFVSSNALVYHERLHTGDRPYPCNLCEKKFLSASARKTHFMTKHCDRNFQCNICSAKFHTNRDVRSHQKKVHFKAKRKLDNSKVLIIKNITKI